MPLILPTITEPPRSVSPHVTIIYGPPKVGKTGVTSIIPSNLLLELEPNGAAYCSALKLELNSLSDFHEAEVLLKAQIDRAQNKFPYKFITIDTIDQLESWVEIEATRRYKASIVGKTFTGDSVLELAKGGGYLFLRNCFYEYFQRIRMLAPYIILIGHVRDAMLGTDQKYVMSKDLDLTGKVKNMACAYADATGLVMRDKDGKLNITFNTIDTVNCGSRCGHLAGKTFKFNNPATVADWKQIYPDIF